jgi:hypothetical protein
MDDIRPISFSGDSKCFIYKDGLDAAAKKILDLVMENEKEIDKEKKDSIYTQSLDLIRSGKFMPSSKLMISILKNVNLLEDEVLSVEQYKEEKRLSEYKTRLKVWLCDPYLIEEVREGDFAYILVSEKNQLEFINDKSKKNISLSIGLKAELIDDIGVSNLILSLVKKGAVKELFYLDQEIIQKIEGGEVKKSGQLAQSEEILFSGYINLSSFLINSDDFSWDKLRQTINYMVRFLDNAIDVFPYATASQKDLNTKKRSLLICPTNFDLVLSSLSSQDQESLVLRIANFVIAETETASRNLAKEKGEAEITKIDITKDLSLNSMRNNLFFGYSGDNGLKNLNFFNDEKIVGIESLNLAAVLQSAFNGLVNTCLSVNSSQELEEFQKKISKVRDNGLNSVIIFLKKQDLNITIREKKSEVYSQKEKYPVVSISKGVFIKVPKGEVKVTLIYNGLSPERVVINKETLGCGCSADSVIMLEAGINIALKRGADIKEILEEFLAENMQVTNTNTMGEAKNLLEAVIKALIIIDNHKY